MEIDRQTPALVNEQIDKWRASDPGIAQPSLDLLTRSLLREKFAGRQRLFQATANNGRIVGQVVARVSPTLTGPQGKPLGMLGNFSALNHRDPIARLLTMATEWLAEQHADCVIGPMDGDTWHSYRINLGPFDEPPFLMEPANPPWYEALWTAANFTPVDTFHSKRVDNVAAAAQATAPALQCAKEHGYRFREIQMHQFNDGLRKIYQISCRSFHENFLYDEISEDEFLELYRPVKAIADPRLVLFVEDNRGQEVGFLFNVVDHYRAVLAMKGGSGWLAKVRFRINKKHADAVNFKSIGILPEHRRKSLAGALMHLGYQATINAGYRRANLCLIRDGNASSKLDGGQGKILRRYALYQSGQSKFEPH